MENRKIIIGGLYRHFKGKLYYVKDIAIHSESGEKYVVYQQLYGNRETYIRPYEMFLSKVDGKKYPEQEEKWRFELEDGIIKK